MILDMATVDSGVFSALTFALRTFWEESAMTKRSKRLATGALALITSLSFGTPTGQAGGLKLPPEMISTDQSIAHATIQYPKPPSNFDPLSASAADLATNGLPPRPDPQRAPEAFRHWKKLVSVPRVTNGKAVQTNVYHGLLRQASKGTVLSEDIVLNETTTTVSIASPNWSGYAINAAPGTFTFNGSVVASEWVVPIAQQAFGACDIPADYSAQWIGFDGAGGTSTDLLQAGTEADALCTGSTRTSSYFVVYEWLPNPAIMVEQPVVRGGDLMSEDVWYTTTPPFGHVLIANLTLGEGAAYAFNPPAGTIFQGDSVEWVLERPTINFSLPNLMNYTADQFNYALAFNQSDYFSPGSSPADTITFAITMVCPPWTPNNGCPSQTPISTPSVYGTGTMWFYPSFPAL
jgi:Peptidase A4 family